MKNKSESVPKGTPLVKDLTVFLSFSLKSPDQEGIFSSSGSGENASDQYVGCK